MTMDPAEARQAWQHPDGTPRRYTREQYERLQPGGSGRNPTKALRAKAYAAAKARLRGNKRAEACAWIGRSGRSGAELEAFLARIEAVPVTTQEDSRS